MPENVRTLEELRGRTLDDVLHEVARQRHALGVVLDDGELIVIQPAELLRELPALEGSMPKGWKDAVYSER
ncbi:MAG: hypothetical protein AABO41_05105 [Acidobacteriota bacterium]